MKTRHLPLILLLTALLPLTGASSLLASSQHEEKWEGERRWTTNFSLQTDWHLSEKKRGATSPLSGITYLDGVLRSKLSSRSPPAK